MIIILLILLILPLDELFSEPKFVDRIPNGSKNSCLNCHFTLNGGKRNIFGNAFEKNDKRWKGLHNIDTDGDGFTNGEELQDPDGTWVSGPIGTLDLVTNPSNDSDYPSSVEFDYNISDIQIYPNPSSNYFNLFFQVKKAGVLQVSLIDFNGKKVKELINNQQIVGIKNFNFNLSSLKLSKGYYTLSFQINGEYGYKKIFFLDNN